MKRYAVVIRHIERGHTEEIDVDAPNQSQARDKAEAELKEQYQRPEEWEVLDAVAVTGFY